jgi:tetratricopeptide (TPR) repeat protein
VEEVVQFEPVLEKEKSEPGGDWLSMDLSSEMAVDAGKNEVADMPSDDNAAPVTEEYVLESELSEPEIGLDEQLDKDDAETRFNLGIAYKEMGLYEEAMKEFTAAAANPLRTVDCLILQGICLGEMGDMRKAEEVLTHGIDIFKQEPEKSLNMKYELGLLYEASGRNEDALRVFRDVFTASPGFRDTVGKIARLHGSGDLPDFSDIDEVDFKLERMK